MFHALFVNTLFPTWFLDRKLKGFDTTEVGRGCGEGLFMRTERGVSGKMERPHCDIEWKVIFIDLVAYFHLAYYHCRATPC